MADFVDPIITAQIVAAKDKLVVEANRAEDIVDQWYATGNLVQDAPSDGKAYNRKDATWVEAEGGAGGSGDMLKATYDPQGKEADAFDRANHTGTQPTSTVAGLDAALSSKVSDAPIDSKLYGRKNAVWEEIPAASGGVTIPEVFTPTYTYNVLAPVTIDQWRATPAGLYHYKWERRYSPPFGLSGIPPTSYATTPSIFEITVEIRDIGGGQKLLFSTAKDQLGTWELNTTGKTGTDNANQHWTKTSPESILDLDDVVTTNLASNVGGVLTVVDATRTGFIQPTFLRLTDTPTSFTGQAGKLVAVNTGATALEFITAPTGGATNLGNTPTATNVALTSSTGTGTTLAGATTSLAGVMLASDKTKLDGIQAGAEVNVQSDWNAVSGDAQILNKPTILPDAPSDGKQYARQDAAWTEVTGGGGGGGFMSAWDFENVSLTTATTPTSGDWGNNFKNAVIAKYPNAADRVNKRYYMSLGGTAAAAPYTFPKPDDLGIPVGGSIAFYIHGNSMFATARLTTMSFPNTFSALTGITGDNRKDKLNLICDATAWGDNVWHLIRLTCVNRKATDTNFRDWDITPA